MCDDKKGCCKDGGMGHGAEMSQGQGCHWNHTCGCPHHKLMPMLLVALGLTFLLGNLGLVSSSFVDMAWPILLILMGLQKMLGSMCKCWGKMMMKDGEKM
ncbi:MAG: DUF5668 domain-containing protein [Patescibacteria group bacterium]